jgi:hypothetical protein
MPLDRQVLINAFTGHMDLAVLGAIGRLPASGARFLSTGTKIFDIQDAPRAKPSPWIGDCGDGTQFGRLCVMAERNILNILNILINRALPS